MSASAAVSTSLTPGERARTVATLILAFDTDPVIRWTYPDTDRFLVHFPELLQAMGGAAFDAGTADQIHGHAGVALWLPPGRESDEEAMAELLERSVDPQRHEIVFAFLEQFEQHHPSDPCWYLPFIGVDPRHQANGYGSALLEQGLARCDRDRLPAYLEATSPRNRALYERHGFEVIAEIQAGDSPPMWPMLRPAR